MAEDHYLGQCLYIQLSEIIGTIIFSAEQSSTIYLCFCRKSQQFWMSGCSPCTASAWYPSWWNSLPDKEARQPSPIICSIQLFFYNQGTFSHLWEVGWSLIARCCLWCSMCPLHLPYRLNQFFQQIAMQDRLDGGISLLIHCPGFDTNTMLSPEEVAMDLYITPQELQESSACIGGDIAVLVQAFCEQFAVPHMEHFMKPSENWLCWERAVCVEVCCAAESTSTAQCSRWWEK